MKYFLLNYNYYYQNQLRTECHQKMSTYPILQFIVFFSILLLNSLNHNMGSKRPGNLHHNVADNFRWTACAFIFTTIDLQFFFSSIKLVTSPLQCILYCIIYCKKNLYKYFVFITGFLFFNINIFGKLLTSGNLISWDTTLIQLRAIGMYIK